MISRQYGLTYLFFIIVKALNMVVVILCGLQKGCVEQQDQGWKGGNGSAVRMGVNRGRKRRLADQRKTSTFQDSARPPQGKNEAWTSKGMPKTNHQATEKPVRPGQLPLLQDSVTPEALVEFGGGSQNPPTEFFLPGWACSLVPFSITLAGSFLNNFLLMWIPARVKTDFWVLYHQGRRAGISSGFQGNPVVKSL